MSTISKEMAGQIYDVLVSHAGASPDEWDKHSFVLHVSKPDRPAEEYRFCGLLGFGGKFRNHRGNSRLPFVDCYSEDLSPERQGIIDRTNAAITQLFSTSDTNPLA